MSGYNKQQAKELIRIAERSIRIIRGILQGKTDQDIYGNEPEGYEIRGLVSYYRNKLNKRERI